MHGLMVVGPLLLALVFPASSEAQAPGWYYIQSKVSSLNLDVLGGSRDVGGHIVQAAPNPAQVWQLIPTGEGWFYVKSGVSGLNLDVFGGGTTVGTHIVQAVENPAQVWKFNDAGAGWYYVQSKVSGLNLDVLGDSTEIGAHVVQANQNAQQVWRLIPASPPPPALPVFPIKASGGQRPEGQEMDMYVEVTISNNGRLDAITNSKATHHIIGACGTVGFWLLDSAGNVLATYGSDQYCVGTKDGIGGPSARSDQAHHQVPLEILPKIRKVAILIGPGGKDVITPWIKENREAAEKLAAAIAIAQ
jgi:hypothetical protein